MKLNKSQKAQMEIIGLVIIVILLTLGMLFLAQFSLKKSNTKEKMVTDEKLVSSTLSSLMKTTIYDNCSPNYFNYGVAINPQLGKELIEDCVDNYQNPEFSTYQCDDQNGNDQNSCDFIKKFVDNNLNKTVGLWGKTYYFEIIFIGETEPILEVGNECRGERDSSSQPLETDSGLIEINLYFCT